MKLSIGLIILMAAQVFCATFFVFDVLHDYQEVGAMQDLHLVIEAVAAVVLFAAIPIEARLFGGLLRRKARLERSLVDASEEVHKVINAHFNDWNLSPAETDVAMFLVKGLGTNEIAEMRGSAEGTVKAHFNAVFRKAGVHSRAELLALLIDGLLGGRLDVS